MAAVVLLLNGLAALLLALLLGWRLFGAVRPVAQAIDQLADGEAVELAENGLLGALAADLNRTSHTLSQQKALLDKRDRTRTQWIAGVSHDIRTPLAIVQGNAAQLADDDALPIEARRKAQQIVRHSQRLSQLVSDLNLASKLEYEMQPLTLAPFRPAALLRTAAADALNETDRDVQLDVEIPPALEALQLTGDASLLGRAIGNLLRNSLTHAPDPLAITLTLAVQSGFCLITVTDNGPGLSDDVLQRLRAPLPQELPTHGLGLILVSQILAAHHGSVNFQNQTPQGLTATLYLPLTWKHQKAAPIFTFVKTSAAFHRLLSVLNRLSLGPVGGPVQIFLSFKHYDPLRRLSIACIKCSNGVTWEQLKRSDHDDITQSQRPLLVRQW